MKKFNYLFLAIFSISFCLASCSKTPEINDPSINEDENKNDNEDNNDETSNENASEISLDYGDDDFNEFFAPESNISLTLNFTNQSLFKLAKYGTSNDFEKEEMYHPVDVELKLNDKIFTFDEVGARMKGNTSRYDGFINENGNFNDKERVCHFKLAFDKAFESSSDNDYYFHNYTQDELDARDKRRLFGMKKIDLKRNRNYDSSFTKELYSLYAFREENVISQHANLINVTINTENDSLTKQYLAYEVIDKTMIKSVFKNKNDQKGDLYKCTYSSSGPADLSTSDSNKIGVEKSGFKPSHDLKTNEDTSNHSSLKTFIDKLSKRNIPAEEIKKEFDNYLDVDYFLRFAAMSWVVGSPDDYRNNYNNYYLYFASESNKAYFIPYDNDRVFGILKDWPIDTSLQKMCSDRLQGTATSDGCGNPLVRRLISPGSSTRPIIEEYKKKYENYATMYAKKYLDIQKYKDFNKSYTLHNEDISGGNDNMSFENYAKNKLSTL